MFLLFVYCLMCYGLSAAFVYYSGPGDILLKFRELVGKNRKLGELFSCMFCLPTNIGFIMSVLSLVFAQNVPFTPFTFLMHGDTGLWPMIIVFDGFFTGAIVSIIDTVMYSLTKPSYETEAQILND